MEVREKEGKGETEGKEEKREGENGTLQGLVDTSYV